MGLAPWRLVSMGLAPWNSASMGLAPWRLVSMGLAPWRLAPWRLAFWRIAPWRLAPWRLAPWRLAPWRLAPERSSFDLLTISVSIKNLITLVLRSASFSNLLKIDSVLARMTSSAESKSSCSSGVFIDELDLLESAIGVIIDELDLLESAIKFLSINNTDNRSK